MKVLVVDDDSSFRHAVHVALAASGHTVGEAADGFEALRQVRAFVPDVILLDWQMPRMSGGETCRAIRNVSQVPIILVSALDRVRESLQYDVSGSLTKPLDIGVLLACMSALTVRRR